jgi:hypothetical protein
VYTIFALYSPSYTLSLPPPPTVFLISVVFLSLKRVGFCCFFFSCCSNHEAFVL